MELLMRKHLERSLDRQFSIFQQEIKHSSKHNCDSALAVIKARKPDRSEKVNTWKPFR